MRALDVKDLITHMFRLVDFECALQTIENLEQKALKAVITE